MYKYRMVLALVILYLLVYATVVFATVTGTVTDTKGAPVAGATVTFTNESNPDNKFIDSTDAQGKYAIDISGATGVDASIPSAFSLKQNYPNPFNPTTTIPFTFDSSGHINVSIYNIMGQRVATVIDNYMIAGSHFVTWNGMDDQGNHVSAGIYLYQLRAGRHAETKKMLLLDGGGGSFVAKLSINSGTQSVAKIANQTTYAITITHSGIIPYSKTGATITDGQTMDFVVTLIGGTTIISGITFVSIPGGTFQMGDVENAGYSNEKPVHTVTVSSFQMSEAEITNAQYCAWLNAALVSDDITATSSTVMGKNGLYSGQNYIDLSGFYDSNNECWIRYSNTVFSVVSGYENWPVVAVTWFGSKAFAEYYGWDLAREAEWEYACRGGKQYEYGTDDGMINSSKANYVYGDDRIYHPVNVKSYPKNPFGLYDMSGNVWEWCADWYESYLTESATNPIGAHNGFNRVYRGGSWIEHDSACRSAYRTSGNPGAGDGCVGFRVVRRP